MTDGRRTVPTTLNVPRERRGDLHQTNTQFLHCTNRTSEWAWRYDDYCITSKNKAENALYDELREEPDRTSNLVQKGICRAIEAVDTGVEKLKQGEKTSQPDFDSWSVVYRRSRRLPRGRTEISDFRDDETLRVSNHLIPGLKPTAVIHKLCSKTPFMF